MKNTLLLLSIFILNFLTAQNHNSRIDLITTEQEAESLIHSFGENYKYFKIKKISDFKEKYGENKHCKRLSDSLKIKSSFYKADFDNNGLTDILVIGDYYDFNIFIVMDFGKDSLKLNRITRNSFQECTFPIIKANSMIDYFYYSQPAFLSNEKSKLLSKKLIYKFGDFIEYNQSAKNYDIEKIEYKSTMCYGTCPQFYILIDKYGNGNLNAEFYNTNPISKKEIKGNFKSVIDENSKNEIFNLTNYLDFPNLKNNYSINATDHPTSYLTITYKDGKQKTITDYGQNGTFGLNRLYKLFAELRFNQKWK